RATVAGLEAGKKARVWLPVAPTNGDQEVQLVSEDATGGVKGKIGKEPKYGNQIYYTELTPGADGMAGVTLVYRVKRNEVKDQSQSGGDDATMFLKPDALVP